MVPILTRKARLVKANCENLGCMEVTTPEYFVEVGLLGSQDVNKRLDVQEVHHTVLVAIGLC